MNSTLRSIIICILGSCCFLNRASAKINQNSLVFSYKSQNGYYHLTKDYLDWDSDVGYVDPLPNFNPIVDLKSEAGRLSGGEIIYYNAKDEMFLRGYFLFGKTEFSNFGTTKFNDFGLDLGGITLRKSFSPGLYLGYRWRNYAYFDLPEDDIGNHSTSIIIWGGFLRANPVTPGFKYNFDVNLSGWILIYGLYKGVTFGLGPWKKFAEKTLTLDSRLEMGYNFASFPINISAGYRIWLDRSLAEKQSSSILLWSDLFYGYYLKCEYVYRK